MGRLASLTNPAAGRTRRPRGATWYLAAPALLLLTGVGRPLPAATSVVAAAGLGALACTDATTRRLPRTLVRTLALALAFTLAVSCTVHHTWDPLLRAVVSGVVVGLAFGLVWWIIPDAVAFGDVKVTALASAAAAAVEWRSVAVMLFLACIAGAGYAAFALSLRRSVAMWDGTVPFVPGLAIGFVLAVSLS